MSKKPYGETSGEDGVICPYCGFDHPVHNDVSHYFWQSEKRCESCKRVFCFYLTYLVSTSFKEKEDGH